MLTLSNSLILISFLTLSQVQAAPIARTDRKVTAFVDYAAKSGTSALLISEDGRTDWFRNSKLEKGLSFSVADRDCAPLSQNTVAMGESGGLTLAYPFLVGTDRACYFDEKSGKLRLLANFSTRLPQNTFSAVYAGSNESVFYFLINGRVFPQAKSGYLVLLTIDKKTLTVSTRELVNDVPGYSAAMLFEGDVLWISTYPGRVFRVATSDLNKIIAASTKVSFPQIATETLKGIEGLNSFMLSNTDSFLYFNEGSESYFINRSNGARKGLKTDCVPFSGSADRWLALCQGNSIELL